MNGNNDIEAPAANENTSLLASDTNGDTPRASPSNSSVDSTLDTSITTESSIDDITKDELDQPWPATFDRGIHILAGPILDEKSVDNYTKSPSVRARYKKRNVRCCDVVISVVVCFLLPISHILCICNSYVITTESKSRVRHS